MRYGHFDTARDEYVIDRPDVPVSFTNYLGSKDYCVVLSHNAGGYSYYRSPQSGRVTRFRPNGVPLDRPGHYVYLRDDADGDYWSVSWQPVGKPLAADGVEGGARYTAAHGMGYSRFESSYRGIDATQTIFVPLDDAVEVWDVRVTNTGDAERTLTLATYVEFSFHTITIDNQNLQMSLYASGSSCADGIIEYDFHYEPWTAHYFAASRQPDSYDSLRDNFIGAYRTETNPIAVERGHGSNRSSTTQNHCGSLFHTGEARPGRDRAPRVRAGPRDPRRGRPRHAGQVRRPRDHRCRVRPAARPLAGQAGRPAHPDAPRGHGHDDQHVDAAAGRDVRAVVAVRVLRRGGWAYRSRLPGHRAGRHERHPLQPHQDARTDHGAAARPDARPATGCTCSIPRPSIRTPSRCPTSPRRRSCPRLLDPR